MLPIARWCVRRWLTTVSSGDAAYRKVACVEVWQTSRLETLLDRKVRRRRLLTCRLEMLPDRKVRRVSPVDGLTGDSVWPQGQACVKSWPQWWPTIVWPKGPTCVESPTGSDFRTLSPVVVFNVHRLKPIVAVRHLEAWAVAGWQMVWGNPRRFAQALQVWSPGRKGGRLQRSASTWACPVGTAMWVPAEFKYGAVLRGRSSIGNRTASRGLFGRVRPPSVLAVPFRLPDRKVKQRATRKRGLPCRPLRTT